MVVSPGLGQAVEEKDAVSELPGRIWVVGPCGSGKSTVADRLGALVGVQATHLDELFWKPGWVKSSREDLDARVAAVVARESWVIDGNYSDIRSRYADRTQLYVWLDLPLHVAIRRLLWRGLTRATTHEPVCNGNYESFGGLFASRDSILLYGYKTHRGYHERYTAELAKLPHVRLRSPREVQRWLAGLGRRDCRRSSGPQGLP